MKTKILLALIVFTCTINAQNFTGKAIYKTSRKTNANFGDNLKMSDEMKRKFKERMAKMNQKTFILNFNRSESLYKQEESLNSPAVGSQGMKVVSLLGNSNSDILYKNIKEDRVSHKTEIQGKIFLIKDTLLKYDWEITGETKNIGNYTCYKAIYKKEVYKDKKILSASDKEISPKKEQQEKEIVKLVAWYTPEIPSNNGPENYWGLPGLILEVNDGTNVMVCTEIEISSEKDKKIKEPKKGTEVTRKKFEEISEEKRKELRERMKNRNGINVNGMQIKIGG